MTAVGLQSATFFDPAMLGALHDDSLYLVTAKSIASGNGLWLPSMPVPTPATKYPPLFPMLLAVAWIGDAGYPDNSWVAQSLVVLLGMAFVPTCYLAVRDFGAGPGWSLAITAITAFHPVMTRMRLTIASEMLFLTLLYAAIICCERSTEHISNSTKSRLLCLAGCVFCLGATLTRTLGVAAAVGIALFVIVRGGRLRAVSVLLAGLAGVVGPAFWAAQLLQPDLAGAPAGYIQTLTYYLSYTKFWVLSLPEPSLWPSFLSQNAAWFATEPAALALPLPRSMPWMRMLALGLGAVGSLLIFEQIVRLALAGRARSLHFALPIYGGILVFWNYPQMSRFQLLFLPLFLWTGKLVFDRWKAKVGSAISGRRFSLEKIIGYCYVLVAVGWLSLSCYSYFWEAPRNILSSQSSRAAIPDERRQAYAWLEKNTDPSDTVIAYEDAVLYLEAARRSMRPINLTTRCGYFPDGGFIESELAGLADSARYIEAKYWLQTDTDYNAETIATSGHLRAATDRLLSEHVEVFRSSNGGAKIFELKWD